MSIEAWLVLVGAILLAMGVTVQFMRRLPVTNAMLYLAVGFVIGPSVLHIFHFNPLKESAVLERITEMAVVLSLFTAGLKMPVPIKLRYWRYPITLGFLGMAVTAALIAAFGYYALGLPLGAAVLLGGVLAPTDPVLAGDVQVRHPGDRHRLRFGLTCEAGINDGSAFPVVMLGLGLLGLHETGTGWQWVLWDVLWASAAGVTVGVVCGDGLARLVWWLHRRHEDVRLLDNFLGLGLIALVYGLCLMIGAYGFLAVFVAAVTLRQAEHRALAPSNGDAPEGALDARMEEGETGTRQKPRMTDRSLFFKEQLEHFSEIVLILIIGGTLFLNSWSWPAVLLSLFVFVIARPVGVFLSSLGTDRSLQDRLMAGWFGIRGIGSLYYLMYAIQHGLPEDLSLKLIQLVLIVVTLSILIHGVTVKPMMAWYATQNGERE